MTVYCPDCGERIDIPIDRLPVLFITCPGCGLTACAPDEDEDEQ